jgi:hypothetical protein
LKHVHNPLVGVVEFDEIDLDLVTTHTVGAGHPPDLVVDANDVANIEVARTDTLLRHVRRLATLSVSAYVEPDLTNCGRTSDDEF